MQNTIYELTQNWDDARFLVNPFLQDAPFFNSMPMMETNAKLANITDRVKEIKIPQIVNYDAPLPEIRTTFEKTFASVCKVGGIMTIGYDKAKLLEGGVAEYIAKQMGPIMNKTGQAYDQSFIYNILKKFCIENGRFTRVLPGQSAATGYYSMIGISWNLGENCGLYSPAMNANGKGKLFDTIPVAGGQVIQVKNENGEEILGKQLAVQTCLGLQIANEKRVHALVNISTTADNGIPTPDKLLEFVSEFETGDPDKDVIYCHPSLINAIRAKYMREQYHVDFIRSEGADVYIDNVRLVKDKNMLKGEEGATPDGI